MLRRSFSIAPVAATSATFPMMMTPLSSALLFNTTCFASSSSTKKAAASKSNKKAPKNFHKSKEIFTPEEIHEYLHSHNKSVHKNGKHKPIPTSCNGKFDQKFLLRAIENSKNNMLKGGGGPFGATIFNWKTGEVISDGVNLVTSTNDPTAHAEVVAIRRACTKLKTFDLSGKNLALATSCEPCPMCAASTYWSRLDRVVFANTREQAAIIGFDDAHIYDELPMHLDERKLHHRHMPMKEASSVFALWMLKNDRVHY